MGGREPTHGTWEEKAEKGGGGGLVFGFKEGISWEV